MTTAASNKTTTTWNSGRVGMELNLVRWGHFGQPVLVFPTAGGDAEEIERMLMIKVLSPLIDAGRIKVYSVDSVAARSWGDTEVDGAYKSALLNGFQHAVRHEVVPAIHNDCGGEVPVLVAGASIGAFSSLAALCRWPDVISGAVCMSGSFDVERFMKNVPEGNENFHLSSPLRYLPALSGPTLDLLRTRFALFAHGGGRWEDPKQDWTLAGILGNKGVPNRVDPWGAGYDHDWPTWRAMLPKYLDELTTTKE